MMLRLIAISFLLMGAQAMGEEKLSTGTGTSLFTIDPNPSMTISVGKTYVTIKPDGTIVYGEGYTPDAAAKAFWDAVGLERKERKNIN